MDKEQVLQTLKFDKSWANVERKDKINPGKCLNNIQKEHNQRKAQGAFYTKLNVTSLMWEMIRKHISIEDYYIWDPCCGTGNLFRNESYEVFDFIDKDKLFLSDIDVTVTKFCKQNFNPKNCFPYNYQNMVAGNFDGMPNKLQKIVKESPEKLFVVCNPPYLQLQGTNPGSFYVPKTIIANCFRNYGVMAVADTYRQYMIWCNEQQIKKSTKCYIVPLNWTYTRQTNEKRNSLNYFRKLINQNFIDVFVISNCEFENVKRHDPIGVFLVGNAKSEYDWTKIEIPIIFPKDEDNKSKFINKMNEINKKYNLKKCIPQLLFDF